MANRTDVQAVPMKNFVAKRDKARYADNDEILVMNCENMCQKRGVQNDQVDGFCVDCMEYLCSTCREYHKINLPGHKQYDKHEMPKDVCSDTCREHRGKFIKFYCESCGDFICTNCKCDKHKGCAKVYFLPLLVQNIENRDYFKDFENRLTRIETKYDEIEISHNERWGRILKCKTDCRTALKSQKQELMEEFDNATTNINRIIKETFNANKERHTEIQKQVNMIGEEVYTLKNEISNYKKTKQRCKLFQAMKKSIPNIDALDERLEKARNQSACTVTQYNYKPEKHILEGLFVGEIEVDGVIKPSDDCQRLKIKEKLIEIEKKEIEVKQTIERNEKRLNKVRDELKETSREANEKSRLVDIKIKEAEQKSRDVEQSSREAEQKFREFENKFREAEEKIKRADAKSLVAKQKSREAEQKSRQAEHSINEFKIKSRIIEQISKQAIQNYHLATQKSHEVEQKSREVEQKSREFEQKSREAEQKSSEAEHKSLEAEQKSRRAEQIINEYEEKTRESRIISRAAKKAIEEAEKKSREFEAEIEQERNKVNVLRLRLIVLSFFISVLCVSLMFV